MNSWAINTQKDPICNWGPSWILGIAIKTHLQKNIITIRSNYNNPEKYNYNPDLKTWKQTNPDKNLDEIDEKKKVPCSQILLSVSWKRHFYQIDSPTPLMRRRRIKVPRGGRKRVEDAETSSRNRDWKWQWKRVWETNICITAFRESILHSVFSTFTKRCGSNSITEIPMQKLYSCSHFSVLKNSYNRIWKKKKKKVPIYL